MSNHAKLHWGIIMHDEFEMIPVGFGIYKGQEISGKEIAGLLGFLGSNLGNIAGIAGGVGGLFGGSGQSVSQESNRTLEQQTFLNDLAQNARTGTGMTNQGGFIGVQPSPSTFAPISPMQGQGLGMLRGLPGQLEQGLGISGQGQETLGRMLNPQQNMEFAQQMFEPIQAQIANRFASVDGARSSGLGQALGRGFAQGVMPQVFQQQGQALAMAPQFAGLGMDLQGRAAQGLIGGGALQRGAQQEENLDANRRFQEAQPYNNPYLNLGLQASGFPTQENLVSQGMTTSGALASLATNQGVQGFLNNLFSGGGGNAFTPQSPAGNWTGATF